LFTKNKSSKIFADFQKHVQSLHPLDPYIEGHTYFDQLEPERTKHMTPTTNPESQFPAIISEGEPQADRAQTGDSETLCDTLASIKLSDAQFRAIELTVQGHRDTQIAQTLGLHRRTLWFWKTQNDDYRHALALARTHLLGTTIDRCQNVAQQATLVLASFLDEDNDPNHRLKAAQVLMTNANRFQPLKEKYQPRKPEQVEDDFPPPFLPPKVG
jgi:hypothetical protein